MMMIKKYDSHDDNVNEQNDDKTMKVIANMTYENDDGEREGFHDVGDKEDVNDGHKIEMKVAPVMKIMTTMVAKVKMH